MKSSVIGLGKLGLPFALFLASRGQKVICFDKNKKILDLLLKKKTIKQAKVSFLEISEMRKILMDC